MQGFPYQQNLSKLFKLSIWYTRNHLFYTKGARNFVVGDVKTPITILWPEFNIDTNYSERSPSRHRDL